MFYKYHFRRSNADHLTLVDSVVASIVGANTQHIDCSPLEAIDLGSKVKGEMKEVGERWRTVSRVASSFGFVVGVPFKRGLLSQVQITSDMVRGRN